MSAAERTASPGFFAQLDRIVRVPILAGAGAALILREDTVLGPVAISGGMMPGQDDECTEAGLAVLAPPGLFRACTASMVVGWTGPACGVMSLLSSALAPQDGGDR